MVQTHINVLWESAFLSQLIIPFRFRVPIIQVLCYCYTSTCWSQSEHQLSYHKVISHICLDLLICLESQIHQLTADALRHSFKFRGKKLWNLIYFDFLYTTSLLASNTIPSKLSSQSLLHFFTFKTPWAISWLSYWVTVDRDLKSTNVFVGTLLRIPQTTTHILQL